MIPQKKLSICADDFGITEKVNRVIIKLIEAKRITETSCIVLSDFFFEDAKQLIKYQILQRLLKKVLGFVLGTFLLLR